MRYGRWGVSFDASETAEAGQIARRLGGYDEMLRLERDLARHQREGTRVRMVLDDQGRRQLEPVDGGGRPDDRARETHVAGDRTTQDIETEGVPGLLRRLLRR